MSHFVNTTQDENSAEGVSERTQRYRDAAFVFAGFVIATLVAGRFDIFEMWHDFMHTHEGLELDELTVGVFVLAFLLAWYSWRRQRYADKLAAQAKRQERSANMANMAKTDFLSRMSHELRTPLNAILGYSEAMNTGVFGDLNTDKQHECLHDIHASGEHLLKLINDILDISKIEANKEELYERDIAVSGVMNTSLRRIKILAEQKNISLGVSTPMGPSMLRGDERRVVQLFINLLGNAIKFTPEGGCVQFSAEIGDDGGYIMKVADTGIGIHNENIEKVLLPFERDDFAGEEKPEGTGLGLPMCVAIMKLHKGALLIDSQPGDGTTVTVRFPPERTVSAY